MFVAYSSAHLPQHVHRFYAGVEVIVELTEAGVRLSQRKRAIKPPGAKQSDVNRILGIADQYRRELGELWQVARG